MNIYNLMPVMRVECWPKIMANLELGRRLGVTVQWCPVLFDREWKNLPIQPRISLQNEKWRMVIVEDLEQFPMTQKNNFALHCLEEGIKLGICASGFVFLGSDDNLIPEKVWRAWLEAESSGKKIIVTSCRRGQRTAASGHGTEDLIAASENMDVGKVTGEQFLIHSSLMQGRSLAQGRDHDGILIHQLWMEKPEEFLYLPNVFVPFNALEPDRWDNTALKEMEL